MSKILAIDLGKFKSVTCLLDTETNETEFWTMSTDRPYLLTVLQKYQPDLVVIESCSISGWVHDAHTEQTRFREYRERCMGESVGVTSRPDRRQDAGLDWFRQRRRSFDHGGQTDVNRGFPCAKYAGFGAARPRFPKTLGNLRPLACTRWAQNAKRSDPLAASRGSCSRLNALSCAITSSENIGGSGGFSEIQFGTALRLADQPIKSLSDCYQFASLGESHQLENYRAQILFGSGFHDDRANGGGPFRQRVARSAGIAFCEPASRVASV